MDNLELGKKRAEELGLKPFFREPDYYSADDIHRLLGEGVEAIGNRGCDDWWANPMAQETMPKLKDAGLIIGIRPIVQESEERKLLRRLANARLVNVGVQHEMFELLAEARRLLEGEK